MIKLAGVTAAVISIVTGVQAFTDIPKSTINIAAATVGTSLHHPRLFSTTAKINLPGEIDVKAAFEKSTFPIAQEDLITRAKEVLSPEIGLGTKDGGACIADDFEFVAAVVGPLGKDEYLGALNSFALEDSFDITQNYYGFSVDPMQTNRVWFFTRQVAKQIAPFLGAKPEDTKGNLELPPQLFHIDFKEDGLIKEFGFYTVDRRQGNTGGLGGAFGYFYGVGKPLPIPECQPYKKSNRYRMLSFLGQMGKKLSELKGGKKE
eukprot:CAMPEP_0113938812 /NCGR_PEP_ID=MMETSP1339-20121228/5235_1 /TAXON_ID=94617 /ORGANISM="Fibrocapsa japonica" /LENGTH=261 /DNA_ID=CAMNT_0000942099 /DNA_START=26 /DNA_END=811 /DNA_ORIENTATION=- /assembly_acc=CAM_ASM_000762